MYLGVARVHASHPSLPWVSTVLSEVTPPSSLPQLLYDSPQFSPSRLSSIKKNIELGMVAHAFNFSTREAEVGGPLVPSMCWGAGIAQGCPQEGSCPGHPDSLPLSMSFFCSVFTGSRVAIYNLLALSSSPWTILFTVGVQTRWQWPVLLSSTSEF